MGTFNFSKDTGLLTNKFYVLNGEEVQDWEVSEIEEYIGEIKGTFEDTLKTDFWNGLFDITVDFYLEEEVGYYQGVKFIPHANFQVEGLETSYMSYDTKEYFTLNDVYLDIIEQIEYTGEEMDFKIHNSRKFNKNDLENFRVNLELAVADRTEKQLKKLAEMTEVYKGHGGWTGLYK